eukprot:354904-Chlamydomonas_euryale.AAC.2
MSLKRCARFRVMCIAAASRASASVACTCRQREPPGGAVWEGHADQEDGHADRSHAVGRVPPNGVFFWGGALGGKGGHTIVGPHNTGSFCRQITLIARARLHRDLHLDQQH